MNGCGGESSILTETAEVTTTAETVLVPETTTSQPETTAAAPETTTVTTPAPWNVFWDRALLRRRLPNGATSSLCAPICWLLQVSEVTALWSVRPIRVPTPKDGGRSAGCDRGIPRKYVCLSALHGRAIQFARAERFYETMLGQHSLSRREERRCYGIYPKRRHRKIQRHRRHRKHRRDDNLARYCGDFHRRAQRHRAENRRHILAGRAG